VCTWCNSVYDLLAVLRPAPGEAIGGRPVSRRDHGVRREMAGDTRSPRHCRRARFAPARPTSRCLTGHTRPRPKGRTASCDQPESAAHRNPNPKIGGTRKNSLAKPPGFCSIYVPSEPPPTGGHPQPKIGAPHTVPERIGRLLTLVQFLIGYGADFAATLRQQSVTPQGCLTSQVRFGTSDLARILLRITRALKLAAMLDTQLRRLAASGQDVQTPSERAPVQPRAFAHRSTTNSAGRAAERGAVPDNLDDDLPSEEQIAALIRRGRAGAVIAAICRDLGLVPAIVSQQQWKDVHEAIITFGGNFAKLMCDVMFRIHACLSDALTARAPLSDGALRELQRSIWERPAPA